MAKESTRQSDGIRKKNISRSVDLRYKEKGATGETIKDAAHKKIPTRDFTLRGIKIRPLRIEKNYLKEITPRGKEVPKLHPREEKKTAPEKKEFVSIEDQTVHFWKEKLIPTISPKEHSRKKIALGGGFVTAFVLMIILSTAFARITITFKPRVENLDLEHILLALDISVSRILIPQKVIPAERLELSQQITQDFPTTGNKFVEERARGKVKIYNGFSSSPQKLVGSTRFITETGKLFRLTSNLIIPGAKIDEGKIIPQYIEAELVADQSGNEFNRDTSSILKIPGFRGTSKYDAFYAVASSGFSGGFRGNTKVVSKDDIQKAQEVVSKAIYDKLERELTKTISPEFKFLDGLREIKIIRVSTPKENIPMDTFRAEASARGRMLVFREKDVLSFLNDSLLPGNTSKKLLENSAALEYQIQNVDFDHGKVAVVIGGKIKTQDIVDKEGIAELIKDKKEGTINEFLKTRSELAEFSLSMFPPWRSSAPGNTSKIKFVERGVE